MKKTCKCKDTYPYKCSYCKNVAKAPKWLDIVYKGRMVDINAKGEIREKKKRK
jgi:hypothetical protein